MTSQLSPSGRSQKISQQFILQKKPRTYHHHLTFEYPVTSRGQYFLKYPQEQRVIRWSLFDASFWVRAGWHVMSFFPQLINESIPRNCLGFMINSTNWAEVSSANLRQEVSHKTLSPPSFSLKYTYCIRAQSLILKRYLKQHRLRTHGRNALSWLC